MNDPYTTLGVTKSANESDIKSAFRKLAKKYHPDQNADNPKAQEKFSEINSAYEILGDKDRRGQYDRGEIDANGKPRGFGGGDPFGGAGPFGGSSPFGGGGARQQRTSGGAFSAEDILSEIFGGQRGAKSGAGNPFGNHDCVRSSQTQGSRPAQDASSGNDVNVSIQVSLEDLGSKEKVRLEMPNGKTLSVGLPAGVEDGQVMRLRGQGEKGFRGAAGDALVIINIKNHPLFKRDGETLRLDVPITLYEAVLGAKVKVPTLSGQVAIGIPKGANGGQILRIKERGILKKNGAKGDILATLRVVLPDDGTGDLETMMQVWRDQRPYKAVSYTHLTLPTIYPV